MSMTKDVLEKFKKGLGWNHKVYLLTFPDGKKYVGQTELDVTKRWRGGLGYKDNREMFDAILWHGWKNIQKEVIADGLSKLQADYIERKKIDELCTADFEVGYNRIRGHQNEEIDFVLCYSDYWAHESLVSHFHTDEQGYLKLRNCGSVCGLIKTYQKTNLDDFIFELTESNEVTTDMVDMGDIDEYFEKEGGVG